MTKLLVDLDDATLSRLVQLAGDRETDVEALVSACLAEFAGRQRTSAEQEAMTARSRVELLELMDASTAQMGENFAFRRSELYDS